MTLPPYAKAIVGALIAALSYVIPSSLDGISVPEILGAVLAALVAFGGVYGIRNGEEGA